MIGVFAFDGGKNGEKRLYVGIIKALSPSDRNKRIRSTAFSVKNHLHNLLMENHPAGAGPCIVDVHQGDNWGGYRNRIPFEPVGIPGSVVTFMVP